MNAKGSNAFTFSDFVFMHSADVVRSSNRSSYEYWMKREPSIAVNDLLNGKQRIIVDDAGRVRNGNTRLCALVDNGYDISLIIPSLREEHRK